MFVGESKVIISALPSFEKYEDCNFGAGRTKCFPITRTLDEDGKATLYSLADCPVKRTITESREMDCVAAAVTEANLGDVESVFVKVKVLGRKLKVELST